MDFNLKNTHTHENDLLSTGLSTMLRWHTNMGGVISFKTNNYLSPPIVVCHVTQCLA